MKNSRVKIINGGARGLFGTVTEVDLPTEDFPALQFHVLVDGEDRVRFLDEEDIEEVA